MCTSTVGGRVCSPPFKMSQLGLGCVWQKRILTKLQIKEEMCQFKSGCVVGSCEIPAPETFCAMCVFE